MENSKFIKYLSIVATAMSVMMYVSYIPQIMNNLSGSKGNPIQPLVAAINLYFMGDIWIKEKAKRSSDCFS